MKKYDEIIEELNNIIQYNIENVRNDAELLKLAKVINIHLELLVGFLSYIKKWRSQSITMFL